MDQKCEPVDVSPDEAARERRERELEAAGRLALASHKTQFEPWLDLWTRNGGHLWPISFGLAKSHDIRAALTHLRAYSERMPPRENGVVRQPLRDILAVPSVALEAMGLAQWFDLGCPVVKLGHKIAASLACTSLTEDVELRTPWDSFVIELPNALLFAPSALEGRADPMIELEYISVRRITRVVDTEPQDRWTVIGYCKGESQHLLCAGLTTRELACPIEDKPHEAFSPIQLPVDDAAVRTMLLIKRLAAAVLVAASETGGLKQLGKHRSWDPAEPHTVVPRRFELTLEPEIDLRAEVRDYSLGIIRTMHVSRTLVRGHFRRQRYGKGLTQVKQLWISPCWRSY